MSWIETIEPGAAQGALARVYEQVRSSDGQVDNILMAHSLRPRTLTGHLALYKAVLHSRPNDLTPAERELVGVLVSQLNGCDYCVRHHRAGLARHLGNAEEAERLTGAAFAGGDGLSAREQALCGYARKLTRETEAMCKQDLVPLYAAGLDDAAILDLNQIVAYFAYANRTVQGLGVNIDGETLGLHPDENREDFKHD